MQWSTVRGTSKDQTDLIVYSVSVTNFSPHSSAVWSESSLGAFWISKCALFLHADNEGSDQTAHPRSLIRVFVGRTYPFLDVTVHILGRHFICITVFLICHWPSCSYKIREHKKPTLYLSKIARPWPVCPIVRHEQLLCGNRICTTTSPSIEQTKNIWPVCARLDFHCRPNRVIFRSYARQTVYSTKYCEIGQEDCYL